MLRATVWFLNNEITVALAIVKIMGGKLNVEIAEKAILKTPIIS